VPAALPPRESRRANRRARGEAGGRWCGAARGDSEGGGGAEAELSRAAAFGRCRRCARRAITQGDFGGRRGAMLRRAVPWPSAAATRAHAARILAQHPRGGLQRLFLEPELYDNQPGRADSDRPAAARNGGLRQRANDLQHSEHTSRS
jgi:hypothetical protein